MTINLSETFANAKNEFINAVNNGEPQERQNELYGDMINQLFEETKLQAKAEAERLAEIEQLAKENANAHIKAYDAETGEILEQGTITPKPQNNVREVPKFEPSEPLTIDLRLILHGGKSQFDQLKEWLEDNFISFETLEG